MPYSMFLDLLGIAEGQLMGTERKGWRHQGHKKCSWIKQSQKQYGASQPDMGRLYEEMFAFQMAISNQRQQRLKGGISTSPGLPAWAVDCCKSVE